MLNLRYTVPYQPWDMTGYEDSRSKMCSCAQCLGQNNVKYHIHCGTWFVYLVRYTEPDQVHEPWDIWLWRQQQRQHVRSSSVANLRKSTSDPWEAPLSFYCTSGTPTIEQCIHPHIIYFRPMGRNTKCIDQAHLPQWTIAYVQHTSFHHIGEEFLAVYVLTRNTYLLPEYILHQNMFLTRSVTTWDITVSIFNIDSIAILLITIYLCIRTHYIHTHCMKRIWCSSLLVKYHHQ